MPTIRDVARKAGVSVGTVSHVLTGSGTVGKARRERVLAAIRELNHRPNTVARSLKTRQTKMLGAIVSDLTNPFFPQLVRAFNRNLYLLDKNATPPRIVQLALKFYF